MQDFYLSKHSGRRLVWHNSLGSCVMKAHFTKAVKELSVSLFQVLLLSSHSPLKEQDGEETKQSKIH